MNSLPLNKVLHPDDKWQFESWINMIKNDLSNVHFRWEHDLRIWEYALTIFAIQNHDRRIETILDVGGGGSILAPTLATLEKQVMVVDPEPVAHIIDTQNLVLRPEHYVRFHRSTLEAYRSNILKVFDAVVCISVIEHVVHDINFLHLLLDRVKRGGLLVLTTDFHPSGLPQCIHHLRTYNEGRLNELIAIAKDRYFGQVGDVDYAYSGGFVNGYSFVSLVLERDR